MKSLLQLFAFIVLFFSCTPSDKEPPSFMMGTFLDDYGNEFNISERLFFQKPSSRYHILKWNIDEQYLLAQNDANNLYDKNLYTRIDWMRFEDMAPYTWGFCISAYKETLLKDAEAVQVVDRNTPIIGCSGLPFSRMKIKVDGDHPNP